MRPLHVQASQGGRMAGLLCLLLLLPILATAQASNELGTTTRTFVIQNARIVQAPGRVLERGSVLVRDGRIAEVGRSVTVPFDAQVIDGDSLVVYAGFIDGLSHVGIPQPRPQQGQGQGQGQNRVQPGNPPDDAAGIQPQREARLMLDPTDKSVADLRGLGFTVANTVPHGQMLPGQGAIVLLTGNAPQDMVLRGEAPLFASFTPARGVYPSTPMGIMAKWRDLYRQAQRRQQLEQGFSQRPGSGTRPEYDPELYALFPVISGQKPVMFAVEDGKEVRRALTLSEELGFSIMLGNLKAGWYVADLLKQKNVPVFVSLTLPEEPRLGKDEKIDTTLMEPRLPRNTFFPNPERTFTYEDKLAEQGILRSRQAEVRGMFYRNPAALYEAGVRFGFSTRDAKPNEVLKNLRTMIKNGLPEDVALAALTTNAADFLGLSGAVGTVEPGKLANLVVMTGPLADDDAQVRMVFVDGQKFEYEPRAQRPAQASGGTPAEGVNAVGTWNYTISTPQGSFDGTITISGTPGNLSGTISTVISPDVISLDSITLDGNAIRFSFAPPGMGGSIETEATINGDTMTGTVSIPGMGAAPLEATRSGPGMGK